MRPCADGYSTALLRSACSWADRCLEMGTGSPHPSFDGWVGCPTHCHPWSFAVAGGESACLGGSRHRLEDDLRHYVARLENELRRICDPFAVAFGNGNLSAAGGFDRQGTAGLAWGGTESS